MLKEETSLPEQDSWQRGEYTISTDPSRLDIDLIHDFISNHSYWGSGRSRDVVLRSIENSMTFGVYHGDRQVGFARIENKNPRSALVIGIAALETGIKDLIVALIPETEWLIRNLPSPPVHRILGDYLALLRAKPSECFAPHQRW